MKKPILIVIAGPNGSGKTTITHRVIKHEWAENCEYINPDEVAQNVFGNWNDPGAVKNAVEYCEQRRQQCITEHKDLIFETVLSADSKVNFLQKAKQEGYFIRVLIRASVALLALIDRLPKMRRGDFVNAYAKWQAEYEE